MRIHKLAFLLIFIATISPVFTVCAENYILEYDTVYIDDSRVYLAMSPATSSGGWVYLNFTSKVYDGLADVAFGYDGETAKPSKFEFYNPHVEEEVRNYTVPEMYSFNGVEHKFNFTYESQDSQYYYNGTLYLWDTIGYMESTYDIYLEGEDSTLMCS